MSECRQRGLDAALSGVIQKHFALPSSRYYCPCGGTVGHAAETVRGTGASLVYYKTDVLFKYVSWIKELDSYTNLLLRLAKIATDYSCLG